MEPSQSNPFLKDERQKTDDSLGAERDKTNESLGNFKSSTERQTDKTVQSERRLTDQSLSEERAKTDSEVSRKSDLLSEEISEHIKTKSDLTTRDRFLAIVSHDLKSPIGAASMCAELLIEDPVFREFGVETRNSIELIKRNIDMSLRLIADLLDIERIEGGKLQLNVENHEIGQILRESIDDFAQAAKAKNIRLQTTAPDLSGQIFCDKDRVMQVLSNLVGNALKFTPKGGAITLGALFNEDAVQVFVSDTGPGIPEKMRLKIFERYAQLGSNHRAGLGLGLYISKMLIEAHHGRLWVSSKPGVGSTFAFTIPGLSDRRV